MTEKIAFDTEKEVSDTVRLANSIDGLTEMVERLCDILEAQPDQKPKKKHAEWHDEFDDETPLSLMKGWGKYPRLHRNALRNDGIITFGDLKQCSNLRIPNFGKMGCARLRNLLLQNGVVIEHFPALYEGDG